jgi:hypothetical protein
MNVIHRFGALLAASAAWFFLSLTPQTLSAAGTEPASAQLQAEMAALRNRVAQLENARAPAKGGTSATPANELTQQVQRQRLELDALGKAIAVGPAGVTIRASTITLEASENMKLSAANAMALQSSNMTLQGSAQFTAKGAVTTISGSASTSINGALVRLNGGGSPVLTVGSPQGSPTVLAQ